jgi:molybdate transport system substrate-binding protein
MVRKTLLLLAVISLAAPAPLAAAEISVLAAGNMRPILEALAPAFQQAHSDTLALAYGPILAAQERVAKGEAIDLVILPRDQIDALARDGKVGTRTDIAHSAILLVTRSGAPKPDIANADALKRALLAASSITYTDPDKGGLSGILFTRAVERLGILPQVKAKTILSATGGAGAELVAQGGAALGAAQTGDVDFAKAAVDLVGKLPPDAEPGIPITAAIVAAGRHKEAAAVLVEFLKSPAAITVIRAKGMEP